MLHVSPFCARKHPDASTLELFSSSRLACPQSHRKVNPMTITAFPTDQAITQTLDDVKQQIRENPADVAPRIFLFQLLAVTGDWGRANAQLELCGNLDDGAIAMVQMYRDALGCEALRKNVFAGKNTPLVFGEPAPWIASLLEALRLDATGDSDAAKSLRNQAFEDAPTSSGSVEIAVHDGADDSTAEYAFEWIADADTRLGPTIEAFINGKYYWVPWNNIAQIHVEAPSDLRDVVWMPAFFTWTNGGESPGLIPTRYPGSEDSEDDAIRLAKKTEWQETNSGGYHGLGQRMFATDSSDVSLMDVRKITLNNEVQA